MLLSCKQEECDISKIIVNRSDDQNIIIYTIVKMMYISVWFYVAWLLLAFIFIAQQAGNLKTLFDNQFGIPDSQLVFYNWDQIMKKLIKLQEKYEFCKVKRELTKLDIVNRISRIDNYLIGMMDEGIFDFTFCQCVKKKKKKGQQRINDQKLNKKYSLLGFIKQIFKKKAVKNELIRQQRQSIIKEKDQDQLFQPRFNSNTGIKARKIIKYDKIIFTQTFAWAIRATLLSSLFQKQYPTKLNTLAFNARNLKLKFCCYGLFLIFLCVPLFILGIFFRILKIFQMIQKSGKFATVPQGNRIWSPWFYWKIRGFNELSHQVNSRLEMTNKIAMKLSSPSSARKMLFKFFALLCGTIFGIVLLLSLFDDLLAKQLFWPMAVSGVLANIFAIMGGGYNTNDQKSTNNADNVQSVNCQHANCTNNLQIDKSTQQSYNLLNQVENLRHLLWNQSLDIEQPYLCQERQCLSPLQTMIANHFQNRTWILIKQLLSILLLPWLFIFQLVPRAGIICKFIKSRTLSIDGVGDIYCHASFDLERFGHRSLMTVDEEEEVFYSQSEDQLKQNTRKNVSSNSQLQSRSKRLPRQNSYRMRLNLKMEKAFVAYIVRTYKTTQDLLNQVQIRHNEQNNFKNLTKLLKQIIKFERAQCFQMYERQFNLQDKKRYFQNVRQREFKINRHLEDKKLFDRGIKNFYEQPEQQLSRSSQLLSQEESPQFRLQDAFVGIRKSIFECLDVYAFERYLN